MTSKVILINNKESLKKLIIDWDKGFYKSDSAVSHRGRFNLKKCYSMLIEWSFKQNVEVDFGYKMFYNVFRRMVKSKEIDWVYHKNKNRIVSDGAIKPDPAYIFHKRRHGILHHPHRRGGWYFHNDKLMGDTRLVGWMKDRGIETLDDPVDMVAAKMTLGLNFMGGKSHVGDIWTNNEFKGLPSFWVYDGEGYQPIVVNADATL